MAHTLHRHQRGAAALGVVLILLAALALAVGMAHRNLLFEQIWKYRFPYRDLNNLLANNRTLEIKFKEFAKDDSTAEMCFSDIPGGVVQSVKALLCLVVMLSLLACTEQEATEPVPRLEELRGQWVVINYWASWCKPCIVEIPQLNALDAQYPHVTVLGVNYDGANGAELAQQRQNLGVTFASLQADPAARLGTTRPVVLPTTLIMDPAGQLVATLIGPQTLESLAQATRQTENSH